MAIKKSELYSSLWKSCDELRGGMDASQYKDYVLTLLFVKYVSDKYAGKKGYITVPEGGSFEDMVKLKGKANIGEGIDVIIGKLALANDLSGIIDLTVFNDDDKLGKGKDMVDKLSKLVAIFQNPSLNFSGNRAEDDDILGDAYEYLMRHFATESGKSKGQFYTPAEVSRVLAKVIGVEQSNDQNDTVYDPTCGSGSLLLKVVDQSKRGLSVYGQEMDNSTSALAVMNMWLHGQELSVIKKGNTIAEPQFTEGENKLQRFDYVVANPPFSNKNWSNGLIDEDSKTIKDPYGRFDGFGLPPAKNGDYTFLLHIVKSLKSTGKGAVILPHGVLFRGNAEGTIREQLIKRGLIKGIIGLPANLFYGTGIPACIIILDKENAAQRKGIFMVDASKGYIKDGNKNRLREQDIHRIVDIFTKQEETAKTARMVSLAEIAANEYNLNIPRYIDTREEEDIQDIAAHLLGDMPLRDVDALENYWQVFPTLRKQLFASSNRAGYVKPTVTPEQVKDTIFSNAEFTEFTENGMEVFSKWIGENQAVMQGISDDVKPKEFIHSLGENLLNSYANTPLVDNYTMYQHLMDYWNEVMKDDVYLLLENGWKADLSPVMDAKGKIKKGEYDSDLVPKYLVTNSYFSAEKDAMANLVNNLDGVTATLDELAEEHTSEDGLLQEVTTDTSKVTKALVVKRLKDIKGSKEDADEYALLENYMANYDQQTELKGKLKDAEAKLDKTVLAKYAELTESDVQQLVIHDKWMDSIETKLQAELDGISQRLTQRIKELTERYATPLPALEKETEALSDKVTKHLAQMGF